MEKSFFIQDIGDNGFTLLATDPQGNCIRRCEYSYDPDEDGGRQLDRLYSLQDSYGALKAITEKEAKEWDAIGSKSPYSKSVCRPVIIEGRPAYQERGFNGKTWWVKSIPTITNINQLQK